MGWPEYLIIAFVLLFGGSTIWISLKAKPLGPKPYRWGTYVAISTGFGTIVFVLSAFPGVFYAVVPMILMSLALILAGCLTVYGLLARRRLGAIAFMVFMIFLTLIPNVYGSVNDKPSSLSPGEMFSALLHTVVTAIYFKRRWDYMR